MDHERLRRAQITESVLRHFHVWLTAMLGGTAAPEDTDRFLPMMTEAGIDLDNLQIAAFVLDGHGGGARPHPGAPLRRGWGVGAAPPGGRPGGRTPPGPQTSRERAPFKAAGPGGRRPRKFLKKALPARVGPVVYFRWDARCRASVSACF